MNTVPTGTPFEASFDATELELVRSELSAEGARHVVEAVVALAMGE